MIAFRRTSRLDRSRVAGRGSRGSWRSIAGCEAGVTMVEAAIGLPLFLGLTILTMELSRLAYVGIATQYSMTKVVRNASLGPATFQALPGVSTQGGYLSQAIRNETKVFGVTIKSAEIEICRASLGANAVCGPTMSANAGEFFSVRVTTPVRLLFLGEFVTGGTVFGKNENWE